MKKYLKKWVYDFFTLKKSEQRGIFILITLTLIVVGMTHLLPYFYNVEVVDQSEFLAQISQFKNRQKKAADSVKIETLQNRGKLDPSQARSKLKPFNFNPNKLAEEQWKAMGLTEKQIKTIKKYEEKGGSFRRKEDLKKIYLISDIEYEILEPYLIIPQKDAKGKKSSIKKKEFKVEPKFEHLEVNSADSAKIVNALNITPWLAARIIKFRNLLGGYYDKTQLYEVYGFDSIQVKPRLKFIDIDQSYVMKLDINNSSFKQLVRHPYVSYDLVKNIFDLREKADSVIQPKDILEKGYISEEDFARLKPYLK